MTQRFRSILTQPHDITPDIFETVMLFRDVSPHISGIHSLNGQGSFHWLVESADAYHHTQLKTPINRQELKKLLHGYPFADFVQDQWDNKELIIAEQHVLDKRVVYRDVNEWLHSKDAHNLHDVSGIGDFVAIPEELAWVNPRCETIVDVFNMID